MKEVLFSFKKTFFLHCVVDTFYEEKKQIIYLIGNVINIF